ncbi:HVA22-like protein h isoform X2 [Raphanus sativus]|uniref:HVA22-like protein n=1 Tax=Raphanus sativus TaxID=3726 RepID=A0A6J0KNH0_RAPSA|nr:HVA22-like protein h isoform X2 [Raphanus sativus]
MQESTLKGHAAFIQASLSRHRLRNGHHPHSTDQSVPFAGVSKPAPSNSPCSISISFTFSGVHLSIRCETMIGSFLTRGLVILMAALTIFERVGDTFASWVPLYCEAKLAFFIYLWFPKTRLTKESILCIKAYLKKSHCEIRQTMAGIRMN